MRRTFQKQTIQKGKSDPGVKPEFRCKSSFRNEASMKGHSITGNRERFREEGVCFGHSWYSVISRYFFPVLQVSCHSDRRAPTSRIAEASWGKIRIARFRLRTAFWSPLWSSETTRPHPTDLGPASLPASRPGRLHFLCLPETAPESHDAPPGRFRWRSGPQPTPRPPLCAPESYGHPDPSTGR